MSHAVVGLLDPETSARTETLWRRIEERHGVKAIWLVPFPHISFHVTSGYDVDAVKQALNRVAEELVSAQLLCDGFGFFTGPAPMFPVLFRPVSRSGALSEMRSRVSNVVEPLSDGGDWHYGDDVWKPHVTISSRDLDPSKLAAIVEDLAADPVDEWVGSVDRLGLILDNGQHELAHEVRLSS